MSVIGVVGVTLFPPLGAVGVPGWSAPAFHPGWQNAFTAWERFDALWFLRIAESGYRLRDGSAAFFPLYPMLLRAVAAVIGLSVAVLAPLISVTAAAGALFVGDRWLRAVTGPAGAAALMRAQRTPEAIEHLEIARRLDDGPEILRLLAEAHAVAGNREESARLLAQQRALTERARLERMR